jgi:hypothetical protein
MCTGDQFALQLRAPSAAAKQAAAARKLAATASRLGAAQSSAATAGSSQSATLSMAQREADAVLRAWSEDDEAGGAAASGRTDMGSLTGWQALAQQACARPARSLLPTHALYAFSACACSKGDDCLMEIVTK